MTPSFSVPSCSSGSHVITIHLEWNPLKNIGVNVDGLLDIAICMCGEVHTRIICDKIEIDFCQVCHRLVQYDRVREHLCVIHAEEQGIDLYSKYPFYEWSDYDEIEYQKERKVLDRMIDDETLDMDYGLSEEEKDDVYERAVNNEFVNDVKEC